MKYLLREFNSNTDVNYPNFCFRIMVKNSCVTQWGFFGMRLCYAVYWSPGSF